jgi:large subunit ribosomal protein L25
MASVSSSILLKRTILQRPWRQQCVASSTSIAQLLKTNPGKLVSGVTVADVQSNPKIAAFLEANFRPQDSSLTFSPEDMKELGLSGEDFVKDESHNTPKFDSGLGSPAQQALNIRTLFTYPRQVDGTNACRKLRWQNRMIPGIVYGSTIKNGGSEDKLMIKTPWSEVQRELDRYRRHFESRVYDVRLYQDPEDTEGITHRVIPRSVQRHPVLGDIYSVNFLRYHAGRPLKIPIVYVNQEESPALKRDGYIVPVNRYVQCIVEDGVPIPERLELDCTGIQIKEVIRIDRLEFPDGVRPSDQVNVKDFVVGPVYGGRSGALDDDGEAGVAGAKEDED